jgi:hypothetical protein
MLRYYTYSISECCLNINIPSKILKNWLLAGIPIKITRLNFIPLWNRVDRKQGKLHGTPSSPFICVYVGQYAAKHILNKFKRNI